MLKSLFVTILLVTSTLVFSAEAKSKSTKPESEKRKVSSEMRFSSTQLDLLKGVADEMDKNIKTITEANEAEAYACEQDSDCSFFETPRSCAVGFGSVLVLNKNFKFLPYFNALSASYDSMAKATSEALTVNGDQMGFVCPAVARAPSIPKCVSRRCTSASDF